MYLSGDFGNGVGTELYRWDNPVTGAVLIEDINTNLYAGPSSSNSTPFGLAVAPVRPESTGSRLTDCDGYGKADILLQNTLDGSLVMWLMDGDRIKAQATVGQPPLDYPIAGIGDIDGDGHGVILFRGPTDGSTPG